MIMWLEGTDEACTTEGYAGKQIDLRLELSTLYYSQDPNTQEYTVENIVNPGDSASYTYNFYDKTREIWTSDRQATESGVTVAPVMQLYDNTTKRGYLMHATEYASYDGRRKVSCWSVDAPQSIVNFGHDIIFRRVNPYNEDEVWNYWHAGRVAGGASDPVYQDLKEQQEAQASNYTAYDIAFSGGNTISFTAFSDGSPTNENLIVAKYNQDNGTQVERLSSDTIATLSSTYSTYLSNAAVPTLSCGGLWGNHAVRTLTLLDATNEHFIHNDHGVMTMNYSYPYSVSGTTQRTATIEYKASDDYGMLYYFIVPESLYTEKSGTAVVSDVKFKRYYNFNYTGVTYAINSERNNRILFDNKWNAGTPKGLYYEIGQKYNSSHNLEYLSYWGSDILYIQTNNTTNPHLTTGSNNMIQVEFYNTSNSSNKFYVVCFAEQTFKGTDGNSWGYTAIVPCNAAYDRYQVQYCYTNGGDKVYRSSSDITVYTSNVSSNTNTIDYRNTLYNSSAQKSEHICVIEYFENITIYFDSNQQAWTTSDKHQMYFYGKYEMEWPGADMYWVTDWSGYKRFGVSVNPNDYNKFIANNGYSWQTDEVSFSPMDNYQIFRNNNGKGVFRDVRVVPSGVDYTKVMHLSTAAAIDWPHYSDSASS